MRVLCSFIDAAMRILRRQVTDKVRAAMAPSSRLMLIPVPAPEADAPTITDMTDPREVMLISWFDACRLLGEQFSDMSADDYATATTMEELGIPSDVLPSLRRFIVAQLLQFLQALRAVATSDDADLVRSWRSIASSFFKAIIALDNVLERCIPAAVEDDGGTKVAQMAQSRMAFVILQACRMLLLGKQKQVKFGKGVKSDATIGMLDVPVEADMLEALPVGWVTHARNFTYADLHRFLEKKASDHMITPHPGCFTRGIRRQGVLACRCYVPYCTRLKSALQCPQSLCAGWGGTLWTVSSSLALTELDRTTVASRRRRTQPLRDGEYPQPGLMLSQLSLVLLRQRRRATAATCGQQTTRTA